jgi:hypothetical protein
MFTLGGISFVVFILRFVVFTFQESPQYLLSKGKDAEALKVLHYIAKMNKRPCRLTSEALEIISNSGRLSTPDSGSSANIQMSAKLSLSEKVKVELKRLSTLFSTPSLARLTILVWVIYAFDYWGFSVAGESV